jgi:hypothetical protein
MPPAPWPEDLNLRPLILGCDTAEAHAREYAELFSELL